MPDALLEEAANLARSFARGRLHARAAELEREESGEPGALLASPGITGTLLYELTRVSPGFALSFGASLGLCGQSLLRRGTAEQRKRWAVPVLAFERIGCWALTEPEAGSDAFSLRTTARRQSSGYVLEGEKSFITNA